jgi:hypothetical protein
MARTVAGRPRIGSSALTVEVTRGEAFAVASVSA